jgi:septal ring factor EnvC (AmiA/AmiB activator)
MKLSLCIILFTLNSFAANKTKQLKDDLANYQNQLHKLEAELNQIDKDLQKYNTSYLEDQSKIAELEISLQEDRSQLDKTAEQISQKFNQAKKAYLFYLMEANDELSDDQLFQKKLILEVLKVKVDSFKAAQEKSQKILKNINSFEQQITEFKKEEDSVYQYILGLENRKKEVGEDYISLTEEKDILQAELDKLVAKERAYKKVKKSHGKAKFNLPIKVYKNIKQGKKGLTIRYQGIQPVISPGTGKIVYVGELASYGQVIMIDHGGSIKSVMLGDMSIKVKKGDAVKNSQILGYTVSDSEMAKTFYFEVRKRNKAQNTAKWIAPSQRKKIL